MPGARSSKKIVVGGISSQQASLLWMLAVAAEKKMPIVEEIDALAEDAKGVQRRRLRDLSDMLRAGIPLPEAVENIPGLLPAQATFAIRVGSETGTLGQALRAAATNLTNSQQETQLGNLWFFCYIGFLVFWVFTISNFLLYFIVPKFQMIFEDFDYELPDATLSLIEVSKAAVTYGLALVPLLAAVVLLMFVASGWGLFGGIRFLTIPSFLVRIFPRVETAPILRNLALVIESGRSIVDAVSLAAYWYPRASLRKKLAQIEVGVRHSDDCFYLLNRHRIISKAESQLLRAAERSGNLGWAMRHIADSLERRYWYRFRMLAELIQPLFVFVLGGIVLIISISFFMPLVVLLNGIAESSIY